MYWEHSYDNKGIMQMECPLCHNTSNQAIKQGKTFFIGALMINGWIPGEFTATCGVCHQTYKFKKEGEQWIKQVLDNSHIKYQTVKDCLIKDAIVSPLIWLIVLFVVIGIWDAITGRQGL